MLTNKRFDDFIWLLWKENITNWQFPQFGIYEGIVSWAKSWTFKQKLNHSMFSLLLKWLIFSLWSIKLWCTPPLTHTHTHTHMLAEWHDRSLSLVSMYRNPPRSAPALRSCVLMANKLYLEKNTRTKLQCFNGHVSVHLITTLNHESTAMYKLIQRKQ